jgi:hypothetical protein
MLHLLRHVDYRPSGMRVDPGGATRLAALGREGYMRGGSSVHNLIVAQKPHCATV